MREFLNSFTKLEFNKIKSYIKEYTISALGAEHVDKLLPLNSIDEINRNLAYVTEMKHLIESDDGLPLDTFIDIRIPLQRAKIPGYCLLSKDLYSIASTLNISIRIHSFFASKSQLFPLLSSIVTNLSLERVLIYNVYQAIDEEGNVKDNASKELSSIRNQISEKANELEHELELILNKYTKQGWVQDEIITTRDGRMVIPVKAEYKNRVHGFIHGASSSGVTVFIEPIETLTLNNDLYSLKFQEQREVEKILRELTDQVRNSYDSIFKTTLILGELDFIQAKANYSKEIQGNAPHLTYDGRVLIKDAYHPILLHKHKREEIIPLNLEITDSIKTLVITGPNGGGKSVAMKTIGCLHILAQAGCHIPTSVESELRIFSDMYVDIGDEQSIEDDLSSFSSHIKNLSVIIDTARPSSCVLIDEICGGTDPQQGAPLAASILEFLTNVGCLTIVTTHHGMLKSFAFTSPRILNGAMEFDQVTLKPIFRYRSGVPGSSFTHEIADRMGISHNIIQRSKELTDADSNKLENLIVELEQRSQELKKSLDHVNAEKVHLNQMIKHYKNKIGGLEKEVKDIKSQAIHEASNIIHKANSTIEKVIKELKESNASKEIIRDTQRTIKLVSEEIKNLDENNEGDRETITFNVGDYVQLRDSDAVGQIMSKIDSDYYLISIGEVKIKIQSQNLKPTRKQDNVNNRVFINTFSQNSQNQIDLRGLFGEEAIQQVDRFIDEATVLGIHRINIVHGKGTGVLRKRVTEYLKKKPTIKSFRLGDWNEGGSGVTIVELANK